MRRLGSGLVGSPGTKPDSWGLLGPHMAGLLDIGIIVGWWAHREGLVSLKCLLEWRSQVGVRDAEKFWGGVRAVGRRDLGIWGDQL